MKPSYPNLELMEYKAFIAFKDNEELSKKFEEAKEFMLGNADPALIKTIDEYHYNVQSKAYDILKKSIESLC